MDSSNLKPDQLAKLQAIVGRDLRFLNKLCARCQRLGWPPDDPVVQAVQRAYGGMHDLNTALHYAGIKDGVWRPGRR